MNMEIPLKDDDDDGLGMLEPNEEKHNQHISSEEEDQIKVVQCSFESESLELDSVFNPISSRTSVTVNGT